MEPDPAQPTAAAKQRAWFRQLQALQPDRPLLFAQVDPVKQRPGPWRPLIDWPADAVLDYRTTLRREAVFEWDYPTLAKNVMANQKVLRVLARHGIDWISSPSGGKGVHTSVLLEDADATTDHRVDFVRRIAKEAGIPPHDIGLGLPLDTSLNQWDANFMGRMMRTFGGRHVRTGYHKSFTSPDAMAAQPDAPDVCQWPPRPPVLYEDAAYVARPAKVFTPTSRGTTKHLDLACSAKIRRDGMPKGRRNLGARILAVACRMDNLAPQEAAQVLADYWRLANTDGGFLWRECLDWLQWAYKDGRTPFWTCGLSRGAGLCTGDCLNAPSHIHPTWK